MAVSVASRLATSRVEGVRRQARSFRDLALPQGGSIDDGRELTFKEISLPYFLLDGPTLPRDQIWWWRQCFSCRERGEKVKSISVTIKNLNQQGPCHAPTLPRDQIWWWRQCFSCRERGEKVKSISVTIKNLNQQGPCHAPSGGYSPTQASRYN